MTLTQQLERIGLPVFDIADTERDLMRLPDYYAKRARFDSCARHSLAHGCAPAPARSPQAGIYSDQTEDMK